MAETLPYSGSTFSGANNNYQKASDLITSQSYSGDTAAARVRSRLAGAQQGLEQQMADQYAGRTGANSGLYRGDLARSRSSYMSNLGGAINDAETENQKRVLEASKILGDLGSGMSGNAMNESQVANWGEQNAISREANQTNRDVGLGQIAATNARTEMERQLGQYSNLNSLLEAFGKYGNTNGSPDYNARLASILQTLFPSAGAPTGSTPVTNPGYATSAPSASSAPAAPVGAG